MISTVACTGLSLFYPVPLGPQLGNLGELPPIAPSLEKLSPLNVMGHILTRPAKAATLSKQKTTRDDLLTAFTGPLRSPVKSGNFDPVTSMSAPQSFRLETATRQWLFVLPLHCPWTSRARRTLGASGPAMLAIKTDAMDVEPDEKLVPTLSIAPSEYSPKRDSIRCFPAEDRHLILLETSRGAFDAESALRLLNKE
jgi:hypothetical protein